MTDRIDPSEIAGQRKATGLLLTAKAVADELGISQRTFTRLIAAGRVPYVDLVGSRRYVTEHVRAALFKKPTNPASTRTLGQAEKRAHVYFIATADKIKIGVAFDPLKRLRGLQTGNPEKLELIATFRGGLALEGEIHAKYARHRVHGEWFHRAPIERALPTIKKMAMRDAAKGPSIGTQWR